MKIQRQQRARRTQRATRTRTYVPKCTDGPGELALIDVQTPHGIHLSASSGRKSRCLARVVYKNGMIAGGLSPLELIVLGKA